MVQGLAQYGLAVDIGAIGAAQVFDDDGTVDDAEHGMLPADREVVDDDVVVGAASQRGALLGQLHFLDDGAVDGDDQGRHAQNSFVMPGLHCTG